MNLDLTLPSFYPLIKLGCTRHQNINTSHTFRENIIMVSKEERDTLYSNWIYSDTLSLNIMRKSIYDDTSYLLITFSHNIKFINSFKLLLFTSINYLSS